MSYRLGVDLGTTFTAAAVTNGMPPTMVGLGNRALQIPSVLFLTAEGDLLAGETAERRGLAEPDRVVREFKRRIGDSVPMLVAGSPYSPQSLTARLLRHVLLITQERMGSPPEQIVLTHPANWGPYKLELLDQVAQLADAGPVTRCPEPVAAATQYAAQTRVEVGATIAVYDLGGGTLDACVLRKTATGFALLGSPEGIEHLGGIDFDDALFQHVLDMLSGRLAELDATDPDTTYRLARLRRDCVDAKEALSFDTETSLPVALPGLSTTVRLTRAEFEALIRPPLEETVRAMERTLRSAHVTEHQLAAIVLIGGSSRIPLVGELLHNAFATPTALDTHPKHDVVLGAMRTADPRPAGSPAPISRPESPQAPLSELEVTAAPGESEPPSDAAGDAGPAGPGPPEPTRDETTSPDPEWAGERGRRRGLVILVCSAAALVALSGVGLVRILTDDDGAAHEPSATSTAGATVAEVDGLPASAKLGDNQLIVPRSTSDNWDLWLADTDDGAPVRRLTTDPAPDTTPVISPNRRTVIYTHDLDDEGTRILLVKGATTEDNGRPLFDPIPPECRGTVFRPAWNPVRPSELAVPCVDEGGKYGLYRITTEGRVLSEVRLPAGAVRLDDPSYSPDGKQLVYWASGPSTWDGATLYTVPLAGGPPKVLVPSTREGEDADPVWSPDGQHVVFRRRLPSGTAHGNYEIFRVTTDGSGRLQQLTENESGDDQDPTYSPSGDRIAYKSAAPPPERPGSSINRIWIMNSDGSDKRVLWSEGTDDAQTAAAWGQR
jgi:Tol biopolymer transport system component/actin-like ATPase involved in cell morphogenesis